MTISEFLKGIQSVVNTRPIYRLGGDGSDGTCDCIGLIIGAVRRAGGEWAGLHGSNWSARNAMSTLTARPQIEAGTIVYKAHLPDEAGYDLPDGYKNHADQRDYYHVGVVIQISPLKIIHCTSWAGGSGIKIDTVIGKWNYGGQLKYIDYTQTAQKEEVIVDTKTVYAATGSTVRLRSTPSLKAFAVANVPVGAVVDVIEVDTDWFKIRYAGKIGWMQAAFLVGNENKPELVDSEALLIELERLMERMASIIRVLKMS